MCGIIGNHRELYGNHGDYKEIMGIMVNFVNIIGNGVVILWKSSVIDMDSHGESWWNCGELYGNRGVCG